MKTYTQSELSTMLKRQVGQLKGKSIYGLVAALMFGTTYKDIMSNRHSDLRFSKAKAALGEVHAGGVFKS